MRRIAVINQKGGVGKTTTTANLGAALAAKGVRVLLIDLDPQAHLTLHFGTEVETDQPTIYELLTDSKAVTDVAVKVRENLALVPSHIDLAAAETELATEVGREVILRNAVDEVEGDHDVLLIDCPPSLGVLTINALSAATEVLIPLQAHFFALQGLGKLFDTVRLVRQRINPRLTVAGVVLCMHDSATKLSGEVVDDLCRFLEVARGTDAPWADAILYKTYIRRNIKLAEATSYGQTVFDYAPDSNGALDYAAFADEFHPTAVAPPVDARSAENTDSRSGKVEAAPPDPTRSNGPSVAPSRDSRDCAATASSGIAPKSDVGRTPADHAASADSAAETAPVAPTAPCAVLSPEGVTVNRQSVATDPVDAPIAAAVSDALTENVSGASPPCAAASSPAVPASPPSAATIGSDSVVDVTPRDRVADAV